MEFFRWFVIPFSIGVLFFAAVLIVSYARWFARLEKSQRRLFWRSLPTKATLISIGEIFRESLLHLKIWKRNPVLGYMHTTFALGWFLLIVVGAVEATVHFWGMRVPLYVDIFFSYYVHIPFEPGFNFAFLKDALLLLLLAGVGMALFKRVRSRMMGMRRTTKHFPVDRIALTSLWLIFPARLLAESITSAIHGNGSFLTHSFGSLLGEIIPVGALALLEIPAWWLYSIVLGVFLVTLPFSRYMHIFTEIPLIFLRNAGLRSKEKESSYDNFQIQSCSRCGLCIDPCQLQSQAGIKNVQSVYFLRDRRYGRLKDEIAQNCFMCGRCETVCPVGIEFNILRLNSRHKNAVPIEEDRYTYLPATQDIKPQSKVGYFAGCMTLLTPRILQSMEKIFAASGENVWWADRDGGICCGRPMKLSGEVDAAAIMMDNNKKLFEKSGITTLVTSCPICFKVFREDYNLQGIEVLHHSQYIERLISQGRIKLDEQDKVLTYHDPCELGRGSGIYESPRLVISSLATLKEVANNRADAFCCGSSLANLSIDDKGQLDIASKVGDDFARTGASAVVTACPLCKKAIARGSSLPVYDLAEVVAQQII